MVEQVAPVLLCNCDRSYQESGAPRVQEIIGYSVWSSIFGSMHTIAYTLPKICSQLSNWIKLYDIMRFISPLFKTSTEQILYKYGDAEEINY